jgi:putative ABC transport system substrate-binding protein
MKRREFITLLGGVATAWPLPLRAQKDEVRRIAVLMGIAQTEHSDAYVAAFFQRLDELGWTKGRNISTDVQWWKREPEQNRATVAKMLALSPNVIVAFSNAALAMLKPMAKQVPIVFLRVGDPVGSGFVASLAHPGGNITGFAGYDGTMGGKWLEVLRETAPQVTSVLTIFQPETPVHQCLWHSIEDSAPRLGLEATPGAVHSPVENRARHFVLRDQAERRHHRASACRHQRRPRRSPRTAISIANVFLRRGSRYDGRARLLHLRLERYFPASGRVR